MTFIVRRVSSIVAALTSAMVLSSCSRPTSPSRFGAPLASGPNAVVAMTVSVTKSTVGPDKFAYVFDIRLDESGGVPATISRADVQFDNGFGGH